ncbi:MAG: B12-binding domain-containing protein [Acidimicrobiia bacterium]
MAQDLIDAIVGMREIEAERIARAMLDTGTDPLELLDAAKAAMEIIGTRFEEGSCFIPELILAGEMLRTISDMMKPRLAGSDPRGVLGKVVFGTVQGDIHDIAKDIVVFMLETSGFDVTDLGVDVPATRFVEAARDTNADIVGLSGFLTLAFDPMRDTIAAVRAAGLGEVPVMIGGGQVDDRVREYTGADAYGKDAMAAVSLAKQWVGAS